MTNINQVTKAVRDTYIPSQEALKFISFIRACNVEENVSPEIHYRLADKYFSKDKQVLIEAFRGSAKALKLDEKVYLENGTKTIAEVKVGMSMNRKAKDIGCIYMYKCLINGKCYVGQTRRSLKERIWQHARSATTGKQTRFYHAIRKYGIENFIVGILEDGISNHELDSREVFYIDKYNTYTNGYNATPGGQFQGEFTEERRRKIGEKSKGRKLSDEAKVKISATHKGKVISDDIKKRTSETMSRIAIEQKYENRFNNGVGTEAPSFKPWWFEVDGYRVNVSTMTLKQYAESQGIKVSTFTKQFSKNKIGKLVTTGMFTGMRFGYQGITQ